MKIVRTKEDIVGDMYCAALEECGYRKATNNEILSFMS